MPTLFRTALVIKRASCACVAGRETGFPTVFTAIIQGRRPFAALSKYILLCVVTLQIHAVILTTCDVQTRRAVPAWDAELSEMQQVVRSFSARAYSPPLWARNAHLHTIVASGDLEKRLLGDRTVRNTVKGSPVGICVHAHYRSAASWTPQAIAFSRKFRNFRKDWRGSYSSRMRMCRVKDALVMYLL